MLINERNLLNVNFVNHGDIVLNWLQTSTTFFLDEGMNIDKGLLLLVEMEILINYQEAQNKRKGKKWILFSSRECTLDLIQIYKSLPLVRQKIYYILDTYTTSIGSYKNCVAFNPSNWIDHIYINTKIREKDWKTF